MATHKTRNGEAGFSLIELLIAMAITLTVLGLAGNLLAGSFNVRSRENQKTDALADAQRALNIMTREIANTGFGLANNGIVAADSTASAIRIRSNLNAFDSQTTSSSISDRNEDVKYSLYSAGSDSYIVRLDIGTQNQTTVLANRVDTLNIRYYPAKISYTASGSNCDISTTSSEVTQKSDTKYIVISVCVELPARGSVGSAGYQPASRVQLVSDVYLRNADVLTTENHEQERHMLTTATHHNDRYNTQRGAALITMLLVSLLILAGALMLMVATTTSATNAISSTDEIQAYYAAEAGLQDALNVLRGNVAPHPNDGTKINFKNAINVGTSNNPSSGVAQLSRWLVYNYPTTGTPDRVTLSPDYSTVDGMAYAITGISDPDNSSEVIYSTAGAFNNDSLSTSASNVSLGGGFSLNYTPQSSTNTTTNGNPTLGSFSISGTIRTNTSISLTSTTFTLQITETGPLPLGTTTPVSVSIKGTFSGTISPASTTVSLNFAEQTIEIPGVGTLFTMPSQTLQIPVDGTTKTLQTVVNTPEPGRLIVKVIGYGPHGASKNMQMMVSRFGITYDPPATFVVRGAGNDSTTASTLSIGSSANYVYSGVDNAGGDPLPAFLVTTTPDYTALSTLKSNNPTGVQGDPTGLTPVLKQVTLPTDAALLPKWLRTTSDAVYGARAFVTQLRQAAQQQFYGCSTGTSSSCDRYFNTAAGDAAPTDFGAGTTNGLFTFIDGDVSLPSAGGKGLLVVTGTLSMNGSQTFDGLVLVLGGGVLDRSGGGNGTSLGAFVVAKFNSTGDFLAPTFTSSGSGTAWLQLDRDKVKTALRLGGVPVLSVSEF